MKIRLFALLDKFLNEALLGFLALLSLFLIFVPAVFELTPAGAQWIAALEFGIVAAFAVEYISAFVLAADKTRFVLNRWRVIDLLIISGALVAFFPATPDFLRNSPALRLLRLGRLALLGTRSGLALRTVSTETSGQLGLASEKVSVLALKRAGSGFESTMQAT